MYCNFQTIIKNVFIQLCAQHKLTMQCVSGLLVEGALNQFYVMLCYVYVNSRNYLLMCLRHAHQKQNWKVYL